MSVKEGAAVSWATLGSSVRWEKGGGSRLSVAGGRESFAISGGNEWTALPWRDRHPPGEGILTTTACFRKCSEM